jgi:hypothetical protein
MTTKNTMTVVLLIAITVTLFSFDLPTSWFKAGNKPKSYEMGIDIGTGQDGKNSATIKSIDKTVDGFGTLMQDCMPGKYGGKRIKMTGMFKSKDVSNWAGLWLRIDTKKPIKGVVFDNMHDGKKDRAIRGTTDWEKYEIVLDVPDEASNIAYGALLAGTGQVWFDNITFEIVSSTTPTTGVEMETRDGNPHQTEPTNLDFEK